jgi:hypothetical protein
MTEQQPAKSGGKQGGRYQPGQSGNPVAGRPDRGQGHRAHSGGSTGAGAEGPAGGVRLAGTAHRRRCGPGHGGTHRGCRQRRPDSQRGDWLGGGVHESAGGCRLRDPVGSTRTAHGDDAVNRMTKRLARIESRCETGNDRHAVSRLIGISVPHGTDADDALADLGIVPEPGDTVLAFVGLAPGAADQRPALLWVRANGDHRGAAGRLEHQAETMR